jgi:hypothetical protein
MKLTYQTGVATLIQFVSMSLLNIGTNAQSVIGTCSNDADDCVSNLLVSLIFYILICVWFAMVWLLGVAAQTQRSRKLAFLLIGAEFMVAAVAWFNINHRNPGENIHLVTSVIDLLLAFWIILLAFRLMRSKGGRVVSRQQQRARRRPSKN